MAGRRAPKVTGYRVVVRALHGRGRTSKLLDMKVPAENFRSVVNYDIREADHCVGQGMETKIEYGDYGHLTIRSDFPLKKGKKR